MLILAAGTFIQPTSSSLQPFDRLEVQISHVDLFSVRVHVVHLGCPRDVNEVDPAGTNRPWSRVLTSRSVENAIERLSIDPDEVLLARRAWKARPRLLTLQAVVLPLIEVLAKRDRGSVFECVAVVEEFPLECVEDLRCVGVLELLAGPGGTNVLESTTGGIVTVGAAVDCEAPPIMVFVIEKMFNLCRLRGSGIVRSHGHFRHFRRWQWETFAR